MSIESEIPQTEEVTETVAEVVETPVVAETVVEETVAETLDVEVDLHEEAAKKMKEEMMKKDEEMKKMKAAYEALQLELNATNEVLAGYKSKEEEMMKKEKKAKRMASLVDSGLDAETAEATVEKFESLDDDTFAAVTSLVAAKKGSKDNEEMKNKFEEQMKEKKKASEIEADASILETAEVEESVNLSVASEEESEIQNTRAALVDFVCIRLGKKLNKGE